MPTAAGIAGLCSVAWSIIAGLLAIRYCERRGAFVRYILLNVEMLRCLSRYRTLSRAETGHVGPLFYHFVIAINLALLLGVISVLVRWVP
jgi:hypothetical protein